MQTAYVDFLGRRQQSSPGAILEAVKLLGAQVESVDDVPDAVRARTLERHTRVIEPVIAIPPLRHVRVDVRLPFERGSPRAACVLRLEDGTERRWKVDGGNLRGHVEELEGTRCLAAQLSLPGRLPAGYHELAIEPAAGRLETALLIAAPERAWSERRRRWGAFLPLYALHSAASWGAGDFSDLERLQAWTGSLGGDLVGVLPLLATYQDEPFDPSPYAPVSRLFWNEFYLDPRQSPELATCRAAQRLLVSTAFQRAIARLRSEPYVDYRTLGALRRRVLEALARSLTRRDSGRAEQFRKYVASHPRLRDYAAFRAATEQQQRRWPDWPESLKGGAIRAGDYDPDSLIYHQYAQWLSAGQLGAGAAAARGRLPGLYLDLPLGVHAAGYDVWRHREIFVTGAAGGAPPDAVFTQGQNWQFPPLHPEAIRRQKYAYFIDCLRHQLAHAAMLRIDHVMSLHRLYWVPSGRPASDGVYVGYHPAEFYAIVSLESHRHQATIVGENLGTVPDYVNRALSRHGVRKMYVVQYEARPRLARPLRPVGSASVAALNTHDMPPFATYLQGGDLDDLARLGLLAGRGLDRGRAVRRRIRTGLTRFFHAQRVPGSSGWEHALAARALLWLSTGQAPLVLVNLEDLWWETAWQNLPGTGTERPNWRRKARLSLEQMERDPRVADLLRAIGACRAARWPPR